MRLDGVSGWQIVEWWVVWGMNRLIQSGGMPDILYVQGDWKWHVLGVRLDGEQGRRLGELVEARGVVHLGGGARAD